MFGMLEKLHRRKAGVCQPVSTRSNGNEETTTTTKGDDDWGDACLPDENEITALRAGLMSGVDPRGDQCRYRHAGLLFLLPSSH